MFNQNPQAKLSSQIQSNTTGTDAQSQKKSDLGSPNIERPKATPVKPPLPEGAQPEQKKGFTDWVGDKWNKGKEWAKDKAWNYAMDKGKEKMDEFMNPPGQPGRRVESGPELPGDRKRPGRPKPNAPQPGTPKTPNFSIPKPPAIRPPKFRR